MASRNFPDNTIHEMDNLDIPRGMNSETADLIAPRTKTRPSYSVIEATNLIQDDAVEDRKQTKSGEFPNDADTDN